VKYKLFKALNWVTWLDRIESSRRKAWEFSLPEIRTKRN